MRKLKYGIFTKPRCVEMLANFMNERDLAFFISTSKYELDQKPIDLGVSYCFPHIIDLDRFTDIEWYNYHPAPLPGYEGMGCYSKGIRDEVSEWGVTLHKMTNEVDRGPIIASRRFPLASTPIAVNEISNIAHYHLFQLFKETIEKLRDARDQQ